MLYFTIGLEFWQLMVLVFLGALLDAPGSTARNALLPELAELAQIPIERATSLIHIIERSARLVGAPLSGLLIAWIGTENVLWLDAVSFFISAGLIGLAIKVVEFERIPKNMRGRVGGAIGAGAWSAMPLGMLVGGVLTEALGVRPMLIGLGITYFITTLSMAFIPAMKEMNRSNE